MGLPPLSGGWVGGDGLAGVEIIRPKADLSTAVMDYPPENCAWQYSCGCSGGLLVGGGWITWKNCNSA